MSPTRLVAMANQMATFFKSKPEPHGTQEMADHIRQFWDPRMRNELQAHLGAGGAGLHPLALAAAKHLVSQPEPPHDPAEWTNPQATAVDAG